MVSAQRNPGNPPVSTQHHAIQPNGGAARADGGSYLVAARLTRLAVGAAELVIVQWKKPSTLKLADKA